ncbi:MAG TPA: ribonuclease D [Solirubrobacteraceae bacterium]|nr:ribonuclease D [Solirubrobacteraceae bacterium]
MSVMDREATKDARPPRMLEGDLDEPAFAEALAADLVALDIETTGLDWRRDRIGTVQMQVEDTTYIIRANGHVPIHLKAVVEDARVRKVLHHAMFDLRFLAHQWNMAPANVACTKIASKLAEPKKPHREHSLAPLVQRYLRVSLDKTEQVSDWADELSDAQIKYAADDVRYLLPLYRCLDAKLQAIGRGELRDRCYEQLPTQVELELGDFPDVFDY